MRPASTTPLKTFPQQPSAQPLAPPPKPELPNPAALQADPQEHFAAAPREFQAAQPARAGRPAIAAAGDQRNPGAACRSAAHRDRAGIAAGSSARAGHAAARAHVFAVGTDRGFRKRDQRNRFRAEGAGQFVELHCRRAPRRAGRSRRAASREGGTFGSEGQGQGRRQGQGDKADDKDASNISSKIRSLLVGASVVVIVLGTFKMAMTLLDTGSVLQLPMMEQSGEPAAPAQAPAPAESSTRPATPAPLMISPTPVEKQSNNSSAPNTLDSARIAIPPQAAPSPAAASDVTGAITTMPATGGKLAMIAVPPTERLPDGIGGPVLRAAALKGDPAAAYEIGVRFAEGKGVAPDLDQAAKWYDRAAQAGVVPAIFRLGTFYEKGLSVKKDVDIARRYYAQAAERGSAKAMHNLAVLDADGGGKGANYKSASIWFRKAADRGVADSQFNLGILYARGIGVEQNLAESFKWFSLAAAQGDADAGRKRDDIAKRLDVQSLAAARLAIQTFTPEPQPDDVVNVAAPAGGWDSAPAPATGASPAPSRLRRKRTAAVH